MTTAQLTEIRTELMAKRERELQQARERLIQAQQEIELIIAYYNQIMP